MAGENGQSHKNKRFSLEDGVRSRVTLGWVVLTLLATSEMSEINPPLARRVRVGRLVIRDRN